MTVSWKPWTALFYILFKCSTGVSQQFQLEPLNSTVLQGSDVRFKATVEGVWKVMTWDVRDFQVLTFTVNGTILRSSPRFSAGFCSAGDKTCVEFIIHSVTRKETGPVECTVQGEYGSKTAQLNVQEGGTVHITGGDVTVVQDQLVEFQCVSAAWFPTPTVTWMQNDQAVDSSLYNTSSMADADFFNATSVLKLQAVRNATVECRATVPALTNPQSSSVFMVVAVSQQFQLEPLNSTVLQGSDVRFNATVEGIWKVMSWDVRDFQVLTFTVNGTILRSSPRFSAGFCSAGDKTCVEFIIHSVTRKETGPVECTVQGEYGSKTAQLNVQEGGTVHITGGDVTVVQDQLVEFQCVSAAWFPTPTVTWMQNDQAVDSSLYNTSSMADADFFNATSVLKLQAVRNATVECRATVPALTNPQSSSVFMVVVSQQFQLEPLNSTVLQGSDVRFNATVEGDWRVMSWDVGDFQVLTFTVNGTILRSSPRFSAGFCSAGDKTCVEFIIHSVTRKETGPVECTVQGEYGSKTAQLNVQEGGTVHITGGDVTVVQDQLVEFQCVSAAWFPTPTVTWMQNDQAVDSSLYNTSSMADADFFNATSVLKLQAVRNATVECRATVPALTNPPSSSVFMVVVPKPPDWTVLIAVVVSFGGLALLVLLILGIIFCYKRKKEKESSYQDEMRRARTQSQISDASAAGQRHGQVNAGYVVEGHTSVAPSELTDSSVCQANGPSNYEMPDILNSNQGGNGYNSAYNTMDESGYRKHRHVTIV
ncbi:hemicentin-1 isoform X2 [Scophthalmus maximus]|uniref:hemicentin-1 isoform X2 n=1 Tax=Scophthalmus maximus TaxID=52904 RepID=UPI001FA8B593|nr:hemicentin-1 isoform X2 [Scophthalmus maximus]